MTPRSSSSAPPHYLTPLLGRDAELAWLAERFVDAERLVTIFGPPGVGKTRLVVEAMTVARSAGSDAVFCDLTEARTPEDVAACVLTALGGGRGRAPFDSADAVATRRLEDDGDRRRREVHPQHRVPHRRRRRVDVRAALDQVNRATSIQRLDRCRDSGDVERRAGRGRSAAEEALTPSLNASYSYRSAGGREGAQPRSAGREQLIYHY